jgi:hypothetical protein
VIGDGIEYVWGVGLLSQVSGTTTTYAHPDGLGSIRLLTDGSGNVTGREQYDAYGAPRFPSGIQLPFTFTAEHMDQETRLSSLDVRSSWDRTSQAPLVRPPRHRSARVLAAGALWARSPHPSSQFHWQSTGPWQRRRGPERMSAFPEGQSSGGCVTWCAKVECGHRD